MDNPIFSQNFEREFSSSLDKCKTLPSIGLPETPDSQQELPLTFKKQWVNTTLKFVTDDTWTTIKYPPMSTPQANFVYSLITQDNTNNHESGDTSLCTPLKKAMKILSMKYVFKASFLEATKPNTVCLLVEKVQKERNLNGTNIETMSPDMVQKDNTHEDLEEMGCQTRLHLQEINLTRTGNYVCENSCMSVFRNELLRDIINLLMIDENAKEIKYTNYFKEKHRKYMKILIESINEVENLTLYNDNEIHLWEIITGRIASEPDLKINIYVLSDNKTIVLTKFKGTLTNTPHTVRKNLHDVQYTNRIICISAAYVKSIIKHMIIPFGPNFLRTKVLRTKTYRYIVLLQMLIFVKNNEMSREVVFEREITTKQYAYVERMVNKANKKGYRHSLQFESDLLEEIQHFTGNDYLHVHLKSSRMSFILEKMPYKNPFVYLSSNAPNLRNKNINFDSIIASVNDCEDDELAIIENDSPTVILSDCESVVEEKPKFVFEGQFDTVKPEEHDKKDFIDVNCSEANNILIKRENFESTFTKPEKDTKVKLNPSSIRCKSESENTKDKSSKKIKLTINVCLVPKEYPNKTADAEFATRIQSLISNRLDDSKILPFLKCHGVKNGALMYSCHTEKSFSWLESLCVDSVIKVIDSKEFCDTISHKMAVRVNIFIDECYTRLFHRLELYNEGLRTNEWVIVTKEKYSGYIIVVVKIDEKSFNYIKAAGFTLFAGVDEAKFSLLWD